MGLARAMGMRVDIGLETEVWLWMGLWEMVWSRSRSWSMMSAEVLIRLSLYLGCGLRVQAGASGQ